MPAVDPSNKTELKFHALVVSLYYLLRKLHSSVLKMQLWLGLELLPPRLWIKNLRLVLLFNIVLLSYVLYVLAIISFSVILHWLITHRTTCCSNGWCVDRKGNIRAGNRSLQSLSRRTGIWYCSFSIEYQLSIYHNGSLTVTEIWKTWTLIITRLNPMIINKHLW